MARREASVQLQHLPPPFCPTPRKRRLGLVSSCPFSFVLQTVPTMVEKGLEGSAAAGFNADVEIHNQAAISTLCATLFFCREHIVDLSMAFPQFISGKVDKTQMRHCLELQMPLCYPANRGITLCFSLIKQQTGAGGGGGGGNEQLG